jgi:carnitine O-acetyltransferase
LDEESPETSNDIANACWHNYGRNRFYDKTLQFFVFKNGRAGFLGEHSMV